LLRRNEIEVFAPAGGGPRIFSCKSGTGAAAFLAKPLFVRGDAGASAPYIRAMHKPFVIDMPHQLGREEAKRRIQAGIGRLPENIPGAGKADVTSRWEGDRLHLHVKAMGQSVGGHLDVRDTEVHVELMLPPFLAMLASPIEKFLRSKGQQMLEDKRA
jgi:hypothetical protein